MKEYNHRKYNQQALKNYVYLSLFESKYAVYYGERLATSIEKVLTVLQFVFMRDITEEEYSSYLKELVIIGTHVLNKSSKSSGKDIKNISLIRRTISEAQKSEKIANYINSIPKYERLLSIISNEISQHEIDKDFKLITDKSTPINMKIVKDEYRMLFECIELNDKVYEVITASEEQHFPDEEESCVLSRDTAIHEVHQGFTHLSRHTNNGYSHDKELERFKSHIRRAALDILKLSIESIRNYFIKIDNKKLFNQMSLSFSSIKNHEVSNVVSAAMPDFKQRYTTLINEYIKYIK